MMRLVYYGRILLFIVAVGGAAGAGVAFAQGGRVEYALGGLLDGSLISLLLGGYVLVLRAGLTELTRRLSFPILGLLNSCVFLGLILGGRALGRYISNPGGAFELLPDDDLLISSIAAGLSISLVVNFVFQTTQIIGARTYAGFILGKYHRPRSEERTFVFLDLAGSTGIAEKTGEVKFLAFLNDFFHVFSGDIVRCRGEIYKYVGDEVIISWRARSTDRAVAFVLSAFESLRKKGDWFLERYGVEPQARAAVHSGSVAAGEIGDMKKEIAFLGDVVNTGSRMLGLTKDVGAQILISGDAVGRCTRRPPGLAPLGSRALRGKESPVELWTLSTGKFES